MLAGRCDRYVRAMPLEPATDAPTQPERTVPAVFGALGAVLHDSTVTDVLINGDEVWADRGPGLCRVAIRLGEPTESLARRLIAAGGRHVDEVTPLADVAIGPYRIHVALPPVSVGRAAVSIRVNPPRHLSLAALTAAGTFTPAQSARLSAAVSSRTSILVTGGTGAGKTTILRALLALVPRNERILTIEDVAELAVPHPHVVALQTRQANIEGAGEIRPEHLVRQALRMRPDRIVLGECRGAELQEMLIALTAGHSGGATVHANRLDDVPARLEAFGGVAGMSPQALARQVVAAFALVVHVEKFDGVRRCTGIGSFALAHGCLSVRVG